MKAKLTFTAVFIVAFFLTGFAQQPANGSFENWAQPPVNPVSWVSLESLNNVATNILTFKDTTTFTEGSASCKLVCDSVPGEPNLGIIGPYISLGTGSGSGNTVVLHGVAFTARPDTLIFDYMFTSPGLDTPGVVMLLTSNYFNHVLVLTQSLPKATGWTHMAIPLATYYHNVSIPDTMQIQLLASVAAHPVVGSVYHIDGLRLAYSSPVATVSAVITAGGPTTFCTGDSVTLQANTGTNYTYQWNLNTQAIAGATSSSYVAKATGSYTVTIDSASATATSQAITITDTTCNPNGIKTIAATDFTVYPNPASTFLNIHSDIALAGFNLQMFDVVGRLVISQVMSASNNQVDVSELCNGTYVYRITDKANVLVSQSKFSIVK